MSAAPRTYLDWNATAPLRPEARAALLEALDAVGNPSSVHAEGRAARAIVEKARRQIADLVSCDAEEVVFTSGATEAAAMLIRPNPAAPGANRSAEAANIYVEPTAHDCLWVHDRRVERSASGAGGDTLAMGVANGETGVLTEPRRRPEGGWFFGDALGPADVLLLDAVQAAGRVPFDFAESAAQFAILSSHKIGGPKGVGALLVRQGCDFQPVLKGGGQERGRRSGTENVAAIAGFGAAAAAAQADLEAGVWSGVEALRDRLEERLAGIAPEILVAGRDAPRLPNTSNFAIPGWRGETQVIQMDLAGYAISAGAACSSGKVKASRVLTAMGYDPETAGSAIRVSLGPTTREAELMGFADAWEAAYRRWRARRG